MGIRAVQGVGISHGARARGIGRRLLEHAIAQARALGMRTLFLGSSTKLPDAIHLYESAGFRHVVPKDLPPMPYTRADVFMEMNL